MYRDYNNCSEKVIETYRLNHINQTLDFVKQKIKEHCIKFDKG